MRLLVDMGHPAHVHFFKNAIRSLEERGHAVKITARDKDVTLALLEAYGFEYTVRGSGGVGTLSKGVGMFKTDMKMLGIARKFKPDVMAGIPTPPRSPAVSLTLYPLLFLSVRRATSWE